MTEDKGLSNYKGMITEVGIVTQNVTVIKSSKPEMRKKRTLSRKRILITGQRTRKRR